MGEEGQAGDKNINLVADTMLVAAAAWGLQSYRDHIFSTAGFGLFGVKGLLGIIGYISDDSNLNRLKTEVAKLTKNFGIPFFVAEMTVATGCVPQESVAAYFAIPLIDMACKLADKEFDKMYLTISHSHALGLGNACMMREAGVKDTLAFDMFLSGILFSDLVDPEYKTLIEAIGVLLMWAVMEKKINF